MNIKSNTTKSKKLNDINTRAILKNHANFCSPFKHKPHTHEILRESERERSSMASSMSQGLIYPPTPVVTIMSVITLAFLGSNGIAEMRGKQLQYSKFWNVGSRKSTFKVSGRTGMFMAYSPAFLFGLASFFLFPNGGLRFMLVKSALTIHFFKRTLEVPHSLSLIHTQTHENDHFCIK